MISICKEYVSRENEYSYSPLEVDSSNRFWKESQIDIITRILYERDIQVINKEFEKKKVTGNRTIMDYTINYLD